MIKSVDLIGEDLVEVKLTTDDGERIVRKHVIGYKELSSQDKKKVWYEIIGQPYPEDVGTLEVKSGKVVTVKPSLLKRLFKRK